jgi:hypothetical protein
MAYGDYIHCCKCDVKLIYDGDRSQRIWWVDRFGKSPEIECPECKTPQPQLCPHGADDACKECYDDTALQREIEDLKRQIESMHYDLDAMSAIKEERDECYVVMRQALAALESIDYCAHWDKTVGPAIDALKERLK